MRAAHVKHLGVLLIAGLSLLGRPAWSQSSFLGSANGLKVGEGRLHPFIDLEFHYDSVAGLFPYNGVTSLRPEFIARIRPGLKLEVPSDTVSLNVYGNLDYLYFTGLLTPFDQQASRLEADANVSATFNPKGSVSAVLEDGLRRGDRINNPLLGVGVLSFFNQTRLTVPIRPGGGALEIAPKVALSLEFFQPVSQATTPGCTLDPTCNPAAVLAMSYVNLQPGVEARWKFLPKTAIVLDASFDVRSYFTAAGNLPPSLLKAYAGLSGLITPKLSVQAKVGWGFDFGTSGANTVLAHLEASYALTESLSVKGGYLRSLFPVPVYGVYGDDRLYVEGKMQLNGRLNLHGAFTFDYVSYYGNAKRNDMLISADVGPEYQILQWLTVSGAYLFSSHFSSLSSAQSLNYARHELFVRVTFQY